MGVVFGSGWGSLISETDFTRRATQTDWPSPGRRPRPEKEKPRPESRGASAKACPVPDRPHLDGRPAPPDQARPDREPGPLQPTHVQRSCQAGFGRKG